MPTSFAKVMEAVVSPLFGLDASDLYENLGCKTSFAMIFLSERLAAPTPVTEGMLTLGTSRHNGPIRPEELQRYRSSKLQLSLLRSVSPKFRIPF